MPDALETALRDLREPASPEFAAELDARVAGGFGATPGRRDAPPVRPRRSPGRWRRLLLPAGGLAATAALLLVVVTIGGQIGGAESDSTASGGSGGATSAESAARPSTEQRDGGAASAPSPAVPGGAARSPGARDRKVERTAALTLSAPAKGIEAAAAGISDVAGRFGGYVESSAVDAGRRSGEGAFVLRLPVDRLDAAMAALARVGSVTNRRQTAADITGGYDTARAALKEARAERTSLLRRLAVATTDARTASLRARLRDANTRIGRALTAVRGVQRRADYARVDITLVTRAGQDAAPTDTGRGWGPGAAWDDARRLLEVAAGVAVIVLAVLGPLALLVLMGFAGRRVRTARARSRVLDSV